MMHVDQKKLSSRTRWYGDAEAPEKNPRLIGSRADYRREDYVFQRTQSPAMQVMEWEDRVEPVRRWGSNFVANLAWQIFA